MANPNYQFEKRQRDLAKKKKQEEKRKQKLSAKAGSADEGAAAGTEPAEGAAEPGDDSTTGDSKVE